MPQTIGEALKWGCDFLKDPRLDQPEVETKAILSGLLKIRPIDVHLQLDEAMSSASEIAFAILLERRKAGEPVSYLLGEHFFLDLPLIVNEHVLIPRPETEELAQITLQRLKNKNMKSPRILDIGTGSGCIALYIKSKYPAATVVATDVSLAALEVAQKNVNRSGIFGVEFLRMDLLKEWEKGEREPFDMIVSNPPYVSTEEMMKLDA